MELSPATPDTVALREKLVQLSELLELAPAAIIVRDFDTSSIQFWNRGAEELYGWTRHEALGQVTHDLLLTRFEASREAVDQALRQTGRWEGELVHTRRDGTPIAVASRQVVRRNAQGQPVATLEINTDISDRKRAEHEREQHIRERAAREHAEAGQAALRASEERYRRLVETANEGIWLIDGEGRTTFANERMAAMLGLTPAEMLGQTVLEFCFEEDLAFARDRIAQNLSGVADQFDFRLRRQDGTPLLVLGCTSPMLDSQGNVSGALGMFTDITERERAAERTVRLQSVTSALAQTLNAADAGRAVLAEMMDAVGAAAGFVAVLDAAQGMLRVVADRGYAAAAVDEWRTFPVTANVPLADAVRGGESILLRSPEERAARYPWLSAIHLPEHPALAALPLIVDDRVIGGLGISWSSPLTLGPLDLSFMQALAQQCAQALERARLYEAERQARAAAEAASRARDELLGMVSHDLRTPLTAIKVRTQLIARMLSREAPNVPPAIEKGLAIVEATVDQMAAQIGELVDIARLHSGQPLSLDLERVDLVSLVHTAVAECGHDPDHHAVRVLATAPSVIGVWDRVRLNRVLANLLSNAVKYSPSGGEITVTVDLSSEGDERWARVEVADRGIGIPQADLPHIFERFYRAGNVAQQFPGEGLGLAGVAYIVEQHGGRITVDSVEGSGSRFVVRLPLRD